jgi:hypothetical protein
MSTTAVDSIAGVTRCPQRRLGPSPPPIRDQISSGRILRAFNDGNKHRPHSTFGNVNAAKSKSTELGPT